MNPLTQLLSALSCLIEQVKQEPNKDLLKKIETIVLSNSDLVLKNQEKVREILKPLKIQIITSLNNPQDRKLAYEILNLVKPPESPHLKEQIPHWKDSPQSKWEIKQFRKALLKDIEFKQHFEFVNAENYIGRGREGIVYLAKEKKSGKLMAIKVKCESKPDEHAYNGAEEVQAVELFSKATGYSFEAMNFSFFNAKSYIQGKNLEELLKSNKLFDGSEESQNILDKLKELFKSLISAKLFFADIAPENFVFDGDKFYMIDLRPFKVCSDVETTRKKYRHELVEKAGEDGIAWSQDRWYDAKCAKEDKKKFMKFIAEEVLNPFI